MHRNTKQTPKHRPEIRSSDDDERKEQKKIRTKSAKKDQKHKKNKDKKKKSKHHRRREVQDELADLAVGQETSINSQYDGTIRPVGGSRVIFEPSRARDDLDSDQSEEETNSNDNQVEARIDSIGSYHSYHSAGFEDEEKDRLFE